MAHWIVGLDLRLQEVARELPAEALEWLFSTIINGSLIWF